MVDRSAQSAPAGGSRTSVTESDPTPPRLPKQIDCAIGGHRTSSSLINAVVGGLPTRGQSEFILEYECAIGVMLTLMSYPE